VRPAASFREAAPAARHEAFGLRETGGDVPPSPATVLATAGLKLPSLRAAPLPSIRTPSGSTAVVPGPSSGRGNISGDSVGSSRPSSRASSAGPGGGRRPSNSGDHPAVRSKSGGAGHRLSTSRPSLTIPVTVTRRFSNTSSTGGLTPQPRETSSSPMPNIAQLEEVGEPKVVRHVSFSEEAAEVHEDFIPYSLIYGKHPSEFVFDAEGTMVPRPNADIREGSVLECLSIMGVPYRSRPQLQANFEELKEASYGERIYVKHVIDGWVKDRFGWLPLELDGEPLFDIMAANGSGTRVHLPHEGSGATSPTSSPRLRFDSGTWDPNDVPMPLSPLILADIW